MDKPYTITIDAPQPGMLVVELIDSNGNAVDRAECTYRGPVDILLLTTVDNIIHRSSVDRFTLKAVELGTGIDKNSSLYRIAQSFAAAMRAC